MPRTLVSRDVTIMLDTDGKIRIFNTMIPQGKTSTYIPREALNLLTTISSFGDVVPHGAWDIIGEMEKSEQSKNCS